MANSKANKPAYEIGDFSGTGYGLISVRARDKADPSRAYPKLPSDAEYAVQLVYQERRAAILADARKRNVIFSMDLVMVKDLDVLAEKLGCSDLELHGEAGGTVYWHAPVQPWEKVNETSSSSLTDTATVSPATAKSDRTRRAILLLDANRQGVRLGLNEAMTDDLDELERIVKTRSNSAQKG